MKLVLEKECSRQPRKAQSPLHKIHRHNRKNVPGQRYSLPNVHGVRVVSGSQTRSACTCFATIEPAFNLRHMPSEVPVVAVPARKSVLRHTQPPRRTERWSLCLRTITAKEGLRFPRETRETWCQVDRSSPIPCTAKLGPWVAELNVSDETRPFEVSTTVAHVRWIVQFQG